MEASSEAEYLVVLDADHDGVGKRQKWRGYAEDRQVAQIFDAIEGGHHKEASELIDQARHRHADARQLQGCFRLAVDIGNVHLVRRLLFAGVVPSTGAAKPAFRQTNFEILEAFRQFGWDITPRALRVAISVNPDLELVKWFLDHGVDPDERLHESAAKAERTPLAYAIMKAPLPVIKLLLDRMQRPFNVNLMSNAKIRKGDEVGKVVSLLTSYYGTPPPEFVEEFRNSNGLLLQEAVGECIGKDMRVLERNDGTDLRYFQS